METDIGPGSRVCGTARYQAPLLERFRSRTPVPWFLFDEILTLAHHDDATRAEVERAYEVLERRLLEGLAARYPSSPHQQRATVAHALVLLIDNEERFRVLRLAQTTKSDRRAITAAKTLLASLEPTAA